MFWVFQSHDLLSVNISFICTVFFYYLPYIILRKWHRWFDEKKKRYFSTSSKLCHRYSGFPPLHRKPTECLKGACRCLLYDRSVFKFDFFHVQPGTDTDNTTRTRTWLHLKPIKLKIHLDILRSLMSNDKYPSIFSRQMVAITFIIPEFFFATRAVSKIGEYLTTIPWACVGYEMIDSQLGAMCPVGYNHLISNQREWNTMKIKRPKKSRIRSSFL